MHTQSNPCMEEERAKKRPLDLDWEKLLSSRDEGPQPVPIVEATTKTKCIDTEPPKKSAIGSDHRYSQRDVGFESIWSKRQTRETMAQKFSDKDQKLKATLKLLKDEPQQRKIRRLDKMAGPKWEELNMDCLVNVLGRVGMESLLLDVPFVCKSWYKASLNPSCWERLIFPKIEPDSWSYKYSFLDRLLEEYRIEGSISVSSFIKFIINRSHGNATTVMLPCSCTEEALKFVADKCPTLKTLALPSNLCYKYSLIIPELIGKWKNLAHLKLGCLSNLEKVLAEISLHCKNFCGLVALGANVGTDEASTIVNLLPNIKYLLLRRSTIDRKNLLIILEGCKKLVLLDVRNCVGFDEGDDQILKLASHICKFKCKGSRLYDYEDEMEMQEGGSFYHYDGYYSD